MNIYFFIQDITRKNGTERVTINLSNLFYEKGHNVTIVSLFKEKGEVAFPINKNINVIYLCDNGYSINTSRLKRLYNFISAYKLLYQYFFNKSFKDSIFIGQNFFVNFLLWLCGKSKMSIACEHFKYELYSRNVRSFRNFIYKSFYRVVVLTNKDKDKYNKFAPKIKVTTIPNMAVIKFNGELNLNAKKIIAVGRLHPQKGFDLLIKAMSLVIEKHPDWSLDIYGIGELEKELDLQIKNLGLQKNVFLKGFCDNIYEKYSEYSIFVLSSRYEGFVMVLLEALCIGIPCVSFNCPEGPEEMLSFGGGLLVENGNINKLSEAIIKMIEDKTLRENCSANKEKIYNQYSPEHIYSLWEKLFSYKQ